MTRAELVFTPGSRLTVFTPGSRLRGGVVVAVSVGLLGCGRTDLLLPVDSVASAGSESGDPTESSDGDPSTGDGDGDPSTGDGDGDPSTSTGDGDGDPSTGDGDGDPSTGDGDGDPDSGDEGCVDLDVTLLPDPAELVFLVDQGAHMGGGFDGQSRIEAVAAALGAPDPGPNQGVIWAWEAQRALGLVGFTSFGGSQGGECPALSVAPPAVNNGVGLEPVVAGLVPLDDSPVADAITATLPLFDGPGGRLILITGRNPDTCAQPDPQQGAVAAVMAAQAAWDVGVSTHLVAVGNLNGGYAQGLANAGVGLDPQGPDAAPWTEATTLAQLRAGLDAVIADARACSFDMAEGIDPIDAGNCTVSLDGQAIALGDPDGWTIPSLARLALRGDACAAYQAGAAIDMLCTCG